MPFFEPDNYIYFIFAKLAIAAHTLNPTALTNPYLLGAPHGFFESPGLFVLPALLTMLTGIPLVWSFRIWQGLAVIVIYSMTLLFTKKVLDSIPISPIYTYFTYTLITGNFLLMQYTQIIEWRGTEFVEAIALVMAYLLATALSVKSNVRRLLLSAAILLCTLGALWMWSGGFVVPIALGITLLGLLVYSKFLSKSAWIWKYVSLGIVVASILLFFFYGQIEDWIISITVHFGFAGCIGNVLSLGEVQCLTPSDGLIAVLMMLVFGTMALSAFLGRTIMSIDKKKYEAYLLTALGMCFALLPLALIYLRLLSLIAPYLSIFYALGVVAMLSYFNNTGSNKLVLGITMSLILLSSFVGQYLFYTAYASLYSYANPSGLVAIGNYLSSAPNATVLTFYGYGDWLESQAHVRVYADTIQGLQKGISTDNIFTSPPAQACAKISALRPVPEYVLLGGDMNISSVFQKAANSSIALRPAGFEGACGYTLIKHSRGFYLFKR